ncbi:MAG TPA: FtsX-like permease family protein [Mucilaginibacter sp.]|nr:FtsX-like permease family protein [Mucilaginibacter sp.]
MIKNYIRIALRNLQRNRVYSLINITGLTIGLAACLLVATVVIDDLSYDRQWKKGKDIYRIITVDNGNVNAATRFPQSNSGLGPELKYTFPEVTDYCRLSGINDRIKIGAGKDGFVIKALSTEPSVWNVFDFTVTGGNPKKFVKGYVNLVISEKIKKQLFPKTDPIGQVVYNLPEFGDSKRYLITGVIKDIPSNTHLRADVLEIVEYSASDNMLNKNGNGYLYQQYLLLKSGTSIPKFEEKVSNWYKKFVTDGKTTYSYQFQPIKDVYLHSDFSGEQPIHGNIRNVYIFSGVAILLLLIACINFINLTTARALKRLREAGIRKVLGAGRKELIGQFLFESLLFFVISFTLGILFYNISLGYVEQFLGHSLALKLYNNVVLLICTCGFVLMISVLTGLYPAFLLSGRDPAEAIRGKYSHAAGSGNLRKGLVVLQFTISIAIIVSAIVVRNQLHFIDHKDLGFDKNNLLNINFNSWDGKGGAFKQQVLRLAGADNASIANWAPGEGGGSMSMQFDDPAKKNNKIRVWYIEGDADLASTLNLKLQKGRLLDPKLATDAVNADSLRDKKQYAQVDAQQLTQPVILTEYTARTFNIKQLNARGNFKEGTPVGIIKDFNNEDLHSTLKPVVIRAVGNPNYGNLLIRVKPGSARPVLTGVERLWRQFYPGKVFQYTWTDETLRSQYNTEQKLQQLFTFFSLLVVFLACLGLFGLAAFTAEQRTKEIGIRKVLGASVANISALLSDEFLKLIFVAMTIASPIAWYVMNRWLQDFAYHIDIQLWVFLIAGAVAVFIAFITISFQSIKAALANPVTSLRSE